MWEQILIMLLVISLILGWGNVEKKCYHCSLGYKWMVNVNNPLSAVTASFLGKNICKSEYQTWRDQNWLAPKWMVITGPLKLDRIAIGLGMKFRWNQFNKIVLPSVSSLNFRCPFKSPNAKRESYNGMLARANCWHLGYRWG